jgi:glycosyltransferase involved in cell wall biosynthesis
MKPRKRVYELLLTFHELLQRRPDFHLHIGGGRAPAFSDYYDAVQNLVGKLKLEDKVTFYGHVDRPEDWYHLIDIYISNGYSEGLQVSALEAMASGCYCLSHNWEGAEELLPQDHLFYTSSQLQERILGYAEMPPGQREKLQNAMRARVCERFNVDTTKHQIRRLVEQAGGRA